MKLVSSAFGVFALLAAFVSGSTMLRQEAEGSSSCSLTGTYKSGTDISSCTTVTIGSLSVPAGVTLDLSHHRVHGHHHLRHRQMGWPIGSGTLDGQGSWYWKQGTSISRPVFFRMNKVLSSTVSGFTLKNMPYRTFSILSSQKTTISGLTLDASAGDDLAKNTDGFDLSGNDYVTIKGNKIYNQDDCLAMQSSTNTVFSNNYCSGGHGISIGSLGGSTVTSSDTVSGLTGGYTGSPTSEVTIEDITVSGLSGTATNLYDIVVNSKVVSDWSFSGITVSASKTGTCSGQPSSVDC
ncbi:polygalacturonase, putative [Phytophthora infestans T30-4]|uniref:endo-polygalacturonase n=1 Tax=Phytophthora infestans (strain T30-4) TaxID=403677 RepID=D0P0F7_PHYIT|nr:polygalacturonase, putative [Phytophthora infestans T30-4]EEY52919.1 polygalacturonase, putative [Phytophthora infestans T30-4]|eukprot:XP_002896186.1 polygalacturonase, putative [Phytophthora infestans T30-4]